MPVRGPRNPSEPRSATKAHGPRRVNGATRPTRPKPEFLEGLEDDDVWTTPRDLTGLPRGPLQPLPGEAVPPSRTGGGVGNTGAGPGGTGGGPAR